MEKDYEMIDGEKIFKALKLGKVTGLGCTLTSAECDYLIAHDDVLTQYITLLENDQLMKQRIAELEEANEYWSKRALIGERWIPVSERLPECEKDVIVFWGKASDGSTLDWFGTAWRNECDDGKWCTDPVVPTHWMPLPEPPEVINE